jgi:putative ABC transport system permease protein
MTFLPLERLLHFVKSSPEYLTYFVLGVIGIVALLCFLFYYNRMYVKLVAKSLLRNPLRTVLSCLAVAVLVFVMTMLTSILLFIELAMTEKSKDLKAIVTERYQIPSQMPFAYAATLEQGAARSDRPDDVHPDDSMTWQFFGGTMDPDKRTREYLVFFFAMDPRRVRSMMDDLENLDAGMIEKMVQNKKGVLMGKDRMATINKRVGDRFKLTGMNYKDIDLEFEIVGQLPDGRYDQSAVMNRDYLNDALDQYERQHNGTKHTMANKTLNLVWLRVPDSESFKKLADQVMTSSLYTAPFVKCETASSGIASFLDAYQTILQVMKWLIIPTMLIIMALVVALTISLGVRERRTEMAVLKVLGFSPGRILALVLGEALLIGAGSGFVSALATYSYINLYWGGIKFPIAFFNAFFIFTDALWWGLLFGGATALVGSLIPAWSARSIRVSEVFAKVG